MSRADLIAELEAATEGDPEFNAEIAETFSWLCGEGTTGDNITEPLERFDEWCSPNGEEYSEPPPFTTSIDGALTLHDEPRGALMNAVGKAYMGSKPKGKDFIWAVIRALCIAALGEDK
ncbi:hypothetical protein LCGC14_1180070 [marine sediment metagenome]|uniref:Uncharacterized protein n=1 Tax=marine sediment metagenome TaxID=412755 RepID=A0A0F9P5C8_9ZZZZ